MSTVKLERQWRRTGLTVHFDMYREQHILVRKVIKQAKIMYYNNLIDKNSGNQAVLFKTVSGMLGRDREQSLPTGRPLQSLCDDFAKFFAEKIHNIRFDLDQASSTINAPPALPSNNNGYKPGLSVLEPVGINELIDIICKSPTKSCCLDPIPTWMVKECIDVLAPVIQNIVNCSLSSGKFPSVLKHAVVTPILKKSGVESECLSNYRPVSNLPFISKVIEKVVKIRLQKYLNDRDLFETFQSGYRAYHSTETALIRVQNQILSAIDDNELALLVLLDLSAAFDTIDHGMLTNKLAQIYDISGVALNWFNNYISNRTQSVNIKSSTSLPYPLIYGVPQGSVLGPMLFNMYTYGIGDIIRGHGIEMHQYADDTQMICRFKLSEKHTALVSVQSALHDVSEWMLRNRLKLNEDKTIVMLVRSKHMRSNVNVMPIRVNNTEAIPYTSSAKNLGVIFDSTLSLEEFIKLKCKSARYHLRNIGKIRPYLSSKSIEQLVHAFISANIDYCNSLLCGLPQTEILKLQRIQNSAARLITGKSKRSSVSALLHQLHWLPVEQRVVFKVLLIVFRALTTGTPSYICDLLCPYHPSRRLRSSDQNLLVVPLTRTKSYGDRSFSKVASHHWNALPLSIRNSATITLFKSRLKTYLFNQAFPDL